MRNSRLNQVTIEGREGETEAEGKTGNCGRTGKVEVTAFQPPDVLVGQSALLSSFPQTPSSSQSLLVNDLAEGQAFLRITPKVYSRLG
jgi:hypothetical protein